MNEKESKQRTIAFKEQTERIITYFRYNKDQLVSKFLDPLGVKLNVHCHRCYGRGYTSRVSGSNPLLINLCLHVIEQIMNREPLIEKHEKHIQWVNSLRKEKENVE